ncbi:MAG: hypothetical protein ABSE57_11255, partial [Bryobacteraceae bacterium]
DGNSEGRRLPVLLLCKLNIIGFGRHMTLLAAIAGAALVVLLLLFSLVFADFGLRLREQHRAFETVDRVMAKVPVPYVRADEDSKIISLNDEVARILGFKDRDTAVAHLRGKIWNDLLADDESLEVSKENKRNRSVGEAAKPYIARLWKGFAHEDKITVEVHAADIPEPTLAGAKTRASFGILLPPPQEGKIRVIASVQPERAGGPDRAQNDG